MDHRYRPRCGCRQQGARPAASDTVSPSFIMSHPPAFARYANACIKGTYRDMERLWTAVQDKDAALAKRITKQPTQGALVQGIVSALATAHNAMRKSGANRGHRTGNASSANSAPQGAQQQQSRKRSYGDPPLTALRLLDPENTFTIDDEPAELFEFDELSSLQMGVCVGSENQVNGALVDAINEDPFNFPCAILAKQITFNKANTHQRHDLEGRYRPKMCEPLFVDEEGTLRSIKCVIFQLGATDVVITKDDSIITVTTESAQYVQLSVQLPNVNGSPDFNTKAKASFAKDAAAAVGLKNLYNKGGTERTANDGGAAWTRTLNGMKYKRETIDVHEGKILVRRDKIDEVWPRSGIGGFIFKSWTRDDTFDVIFLPNDTTFDKARAVAQRLGPLAYGLVLGPRGIAVRVMPGEKNQARQAIDPELTSAIGDAALTLPTGDGCLLEVIGIPMQMSDKEVVQNLTMPTAAGPWTCQPLKRIPSKAYGTKNLLVRAARKPPKEVFRLACGYSLYPIQIKVHTMPRRQHNPLDRALLNSREARDVAATTMGAAPKAMAKRTMPPRSPWHEESDVPDAPMGTPDLDAGAAPAGGTNTAEEAADEIGYLSCCSNSKITQRRGYAAQQAPAQAKTQAPFAMSALEKRFELIDQQRKENHKNAQTHK